MLIGATASSGTPVNEWTSLGVPAVSRCVDLLADLMGAIPLKLFRHSASGNDEQKDHPAILAMQNPGDMHTSTEIRRLIQCGHSLGGNGYGRVHRDAYGDPAEIEWLRPCNVQPFKVSGRNMVAFNVVGERNPLTRYDMLYIRGKSLDGIVGLSPMRLLREQIGTSIAQTQAAGSLMRNGLRTPGLMQSKTMVKGEVLTAASDEFNTKNTGAQNAGRVPFVNGDWEFKQTNGMSMKDAEFIDSWAFGDRQIACVFGIPPVLIGGDGATTWGSGIEQIWQGFLTLTFNPLLVLWEESLNYTLLTTAERKAGFYFKFNRRALLSVNLDSQAKFLETMRKIGVYNVDRCREFLDENKVEDPAIGQNYALPFNAQGGVPTALPTPEPSPA
jgi:HK97 family phage portal protein